ncbi:hypothetical protein ABZY58_13545 [Micromonospora tulbaghiae]|uniref:acyl-CoA-like ligand-binding transcription factor n=1 Tax=Micromonospora tulbaghiae TaxID=479978 RepID=UPI0033B84890
MLAARIVAAPPEVSAFDALRLAFDDVVEAIEADREVWLLRLRVIAANPSLLPRLISGNAETEQVIVAAVAARLGLDPCHGHPTLVTTVAGAVFRTALITRYGRWKMFLVAGAAVMTVGMLLLSTIDASTSVPVLSVYMAVLGVGVGMLLQNLVLAAQNDVPAAELGAATSVLTFFRSMGGAVGVSALGAVLANRVTALTVERLGPIAAGGGSAEVPDLSALPEPVLRVVQDVYGIATSEMFLIGAPFALLALIVVLFIKEKPLNTLSGDERRAREEAAAAAGMH